MTLRFDGLVAAAFTPLTAEGDLDLSTIPALVEHARTSGCVGLYVCGSTGQGLSLSSNERRAVAEAFLGAAAGRLPILVQVGHESVAEARALARHAQECGADAVSALPPTFFKPATAEALFDVLEEIAGAAPELPFYYYNIPELSGVRTSMLELLERGAERLPTLAGIKYTAPTLDELQACVEAAGERFQVLYGRDEMLLAALAVGAEAAIGSTYNLIAPVYLRLIDAFRHGDLAGAREEQSRSLALIRLIPRYGPACLKEMMAVLGVDCGPPRLPVLPLAADERAALRDDLRRIGALEWSAAAAAPGE